MKRLTLILAVLALFPWPALGTGDDTFETRLSLLVGYPSADEGDAKGVLMIPGTVIPFSPEPVTLKSRIADAEEARSARLIAVAENLKKAMRLEKVDVRYQMSLPLELDVARDLPGPNESSPLRITVELRGFNDRSTLYEVQFHERSTAIVDTSVSVQRGSRAVLGALDGDEAPYLFLVIEPEAEAPRRDRTAGPLHVDEHITPPRALVKTPPSYTEVARKDRVQGVVIVRTVINEQGLVEDVEVLKGLSGGLTEVAVEAIKTWQFEPALLDGEPVSVYYNLTINFRLEDKKEEEEGDGS